MNALTSTLPQLNATQERILQLLGQNFPASVVASAVGVDESYVSQLLSQEAFAQAVQERRFLATQKSVQLDDKYDSIETKLLEKLEKSIPLIVRPHDITKTLQMVNSAKRRSTPLSTGANVTQNIVNLVLPTAILNRFVSNGNNQIVEVQDGTGKQTTLVTATSGALERLAREVSPVEFTQLPSSGTSGNSASSSNFSEEACESWRSDLPSEISFAPKGPSPRTGSTQKITAEDL